jgi:predicted O-methyltransferase YrrM
MKTALIRFVKEIQFWSPLRRYFFYRYQYLFTPGQLSYLCSCLEATKNVPGSILEVGCAAGHTTVFLNKHLDALAIEKPYTAIDTFEGFTKADIEVEVRERGKDASDLGGFAVNRQRWYDATMHTNGVRRVRSIKADAVHFQYATLGPLSFCLVDVDLYRPVKAALEGIFDQMQPGGIIVVDDCAASRLYDGALQAYMECCASKGYPPTVVHEKLGVLVKT